MRCLAGCTWLWRAEGFDGGEGVAGGAVGW